MTEVDHLRAASDTQHARERVAHHVEADAEARTGVAGQAFKNLVRRFKAIRHHLPAELRCAALEITRDGGPPIARVARRRGRVVDVFADGQAANESSVSTDVLELSGDGRDSDDEGGAYAAG